MAWPWWWFQISGATATPIEIIRCCGFDIPCWVTQIPQFSPAFWLHQIFSYRHRITINKAALYIESHIFSWRKLAATFIDTTPVIQISTLMFTFILNNAPTMPSIALYFSWLHNEPMWHRHQKLYCCSFVATTSGFTPANGTNYRTPSPSCHFYWFWHLFEST